MARLVLSALAATAEPDPVDSTLISSELGLGSDSGEISNFAMPPHASLGSFCPGPNAFRAAAMDRKDGGNLLHCNLNSDSGPDGLPHFPSILVQRCRVLGLVSDGRFGFEATFRGARGRAKVSMSILKRVAGCTFVAGIGAALLGPSLMRRLWEVCCATVLKPQALVRRGRVCST